MTVNHAKSLDRLVARVDEDRWLSSRYAPAPQRSALVALYGLNFELARIRLVVSEPTLGAIRFQWWREAIGEMDDPVRAGRHPVTAGLAPVLASGAVPAAGLLELVDGHQNAFETGDRAREPEGPLAVMAARLLAAGDLEGAGRIAAVAADFAAARRGDPAGQGGASAGVRAGHAEGHSAGPGEGLGEGLGEGPGDLDAQAEGAGRVDGERLRVPAPLRPALAHMALRHTYRRAAGRKDAGQARDGPSALRKRLIVLGAVLTGRI